MPCLTQRNAQILTGQVTGDAESIVVLHICCAHPRAADADADEAGVADDEDEDDMVQIVGVQPGAADADEAGDAEADADLAYDADNEDDADGVHIRGVRPGAWQQPSTGLLKDRPKRPAT